jgi:hypothetical protein
MVWHTQAATGVGQTATGVAAAAAQTATGVAGVPCHWPPNAAQGAGAVSKAAAWYHQLQLQGDKLQERHPPAPKAATGAAVAGKAATGVAGKAATGVDRQPPAPKAATRRRKRAKALKALSRMNHMQAMKDIRWFTKVIKADLEKVKAMRYKHWDRLGYRLNIITSTRIKEGRVKKLTSIPEIRKRAAAIWAASKRNTPVSRPSS